MENLHRFFAICSLFDSRRYSIPLDTILAELECSEPTFKRLLSNLRSYGYPIRYDRKNKGYVFDRDASIQIPGLWFNANELQTLLIIRQLLKKIQAGFLTRYFQKLETYTDKLLASTGKDVEKISHLIQIIPITHQYIPSEIFTALGRAIFDGLQLNILYQDIHGNMSERNVSIQRLVYYRDHWYIDAWCHFRNGLRTFWVAGIKSSKVKDESSYILTKEELSALDSGYGIFEGKVTQVAHLRFSGLAAMRVSGAEWHPNQKQQINDNGTVDLWVPYNDHRELVMDILRYSYEAVVLSPDSLRQEIIKRLKSTLNLYAFDGNNC